MIHLGRTVLAMDCVLAGAEWHHGRPLSSVVRPHHLNTLAPEGLNYISSWVTEDLSTCFQVMETENRALLEDWMSRWADLVIFEVHPVITSKEAAEQVET